jgi:hypothetical protein
VCIPLVTGSRGHDFSVPLQQKNITQYQWVIHFWRSNIFGIRIAVYDMKLKPNESIHNT